MQSEPLVSVVTPVYNGEKYIAQCIESVLTQTYENWEYVIVNNCSTDSTFEIASRYAENETRIKVINNDKFLGIIQNWNHALRQISPLSAYCKVVHADDSLFEDCIEKMVKVGEAHPDVSIIGAFRLEGDKVTGDGIPYPKVIVSGRDICRSSFSARTAKFGSPTMFLIRSETIRKRDPFYNEALLHADTDVCYDVLRNSDFGFVHQILSYTRRHDQSCSETVARKVRTTFTEHFGMFLKYGPIYFNNAEYEKLLKRKSREYYRLLARGLLKRNGKTFWKYHKNNLESMGYPLSIGRLLIAVIYEILYMSFNLQITMERIRSFRGQKKISAKS